MAIQLESDLARSVISHMNDDHFDAVLAYVQAFGGKKRAVSARIFDLHSTGMWISYCEGGVEAEYWLAFETPVSGANDIRAELVRLASEARALLAGESGSQD